MSEKLGKLMYELDLDEMGIVLGYCTPHECSNYLAELFKKAKAKKKEDEAK